MSPFSQKAIPKFNASSVTEWGVVVLVGILHGICPLAAVQQLETILVNCRFIIITQLKSVKVETWWVRIESKQDLFQKIVGFDLCHLVEKWFPYLAINLLPKRDKHGMNLPVQFSWRPNSVIVYL